MAGLFDGEGSIGINRIKNYNGTGTPYYRLMVQVCMTEFYIPKWLHFTFGGSLQIRKFPKPRRDIAHWQIANRQAADFLRAILPYLKIKRPQAEVALKFQSDRKQSGGAMSKNGRPFKTKEEAVVEEAQCILVKNMKQGNGGNNG